MSTIKADYGQGATSDESVGSANHPPLAEVLRDIATDLATVDLASVETIAAADLAAFTDPPDALEMAALRTLVNEIKTKINAAATAKAAAGAILTIKG
jgi:hypothetical protein